MIDTIDYLKKLIKAKGTATSNVTNITLETAYRLISKGELMPVYETSKETKSAINNCLKKSELGITLEKKYKDITKYEEQPKDIVRFANIVNEIEEFYHISLDKEKIGLKRNRVVKCACGSICTLQYSEKRSREEWVCPECGASVGVHKGTSIPLGTPDSSQVRNLRIEVHKEIDRIIKSGMSKPYVYKLLSKKMNMTIDETHAGMFNEVQCRKALEILSSINGKFNLG